MREKHSVIWISPPICWKVSINCCKFIDYVNPLNKFHFRSFSATFENIYCFSLTTSTMSPHFFLQPHFYFPKAPIYLCLPFCTNLKFSPWSSLNFIPWDNFRKYLCSKLWKIIIDASLPATPSPINSLGHKKLLQPTLQCYPLLLLSSGSSEYTSPTLLKVIRILTIKTNNYRQPMMI